MPLSVTDAYQQVKQDIQLLSDSSLYAVLPAAAKLAVRASALDDAQAFGAELLSAATDPKDWNYGNLIFYGNMILGQVALRNGDTAGAEDRLLSSGKTPGSPQLNSFGPNMSLVLDLLTAPAGASAVLNHLRPRPTKKAPASPDVQQTVLLFFDLCKTFWVTGNKQLELWSQQVQVGVLPDFGANLVY
jgi:hypothetical protein